MVDARTHEMILAMLENEAKAGRIARFGKLLMRLVWLACDAYWETYGKDDGEGTKPKG